MRSKVFLTVTVVALTGGLVRASSNNIYIAQSMAGANNGQDCADAYAYTFFNTPGNWGTNAGLIGPGTTVHLCGTFTAPAGADSFLQFQGSGLAGNPVTLFFENGAILQSPYFGSVAGAIDTNGNTNLTINGGTNGVLQNTANGTKLAHQQNSYGIEMAGCNSCVVENLTIANMYVHAGLADSGDVQAIPIRMLDGNNITIGPNNTIHDGRFCLLYAYGATDSNLTILGNTIYNCDHGVAVGNNPTGTLTTVVVHDNIFHDWTNWDDTMDYYHHNAVHIWAVAAGGTINGVSVYNNYMYGDVGIHATAILFLEANSGGVMTGANVFNNVFNSTNAADNAGEGLVDVQPGNCGIYNNTFQTALNTNASIGLHLYSAGCSVVNNIFNVIWVPIFPEAGAKFQTSDYNDFSSFNSFDYQGTFVNSLPAWRAACSCDSHSITGNPKLGSNFRPPANSPVVGTATNLTSLGIMPLDSDKGAVPRGIAWDMGAYGAAVSRPVPPTGLSAIVH